MAVEAVSIVLLFFSSHLSIAVRASIVSIEDDSAEYASHWSTCILSSPRAMAAPR